MPLSKYVGRDVLVTGPLGSRAPEVAALAPEDLPALASEAATTGAE